MTEPVEVPEHPDEPTPEDAPPEPSEPQEPSEEEQAEDETPEAPEAPPEGSDEQTQALSEKQVERAFQKLDKSASVWRRRVGEIMGADVAMLQDCPLCEPIIPGFVMPTPQLPERFPAVRTFIGDAQPRVLRRDPKTRQCETCGGEGVVDTDSHVAGQAELPCTDCGGKGWVGDRAPVAVSVTSVTHAAPATNGPSTPNVSTEEWAEIERLRAKGIVVYVPPAPPAPVA